MNPTSGTGSRSSAGIAALLLMSFAAGNTLALDQPPAEPEQQRAWLVGHLVTDMKGLGIYSADDFAKVSDTVNDMTDDQVALLAQYYYLTRAKTQQDASLYAMQQQGYSDADVDEQKTQIADILTQLQDETDACYAGLQTLGTPVQYLGQVVYSSVPGWCVYSRCCIPDWYFANGCYVGCAFNPAYCGNYAQPVCAAYYDNGSYFNSFYDRSAYIDRSINRARRQANWYRNHDWQNNLRHDRLVSHSVNPYRHDANQQVGHQGRPQGGHNGTNRNGGHNAHNGGHGYRGGQFAHIGGHGGGGAGHVSRGAGHAARSMAHSGGHGGGHARASSAGGHSHSGGRGGGHSGGGAHAAHGSSVHAPRAAHAAHGGHGGHAAHAASHAAPVGGHGGGHASHAPSGRGRHK